MVRKILGVIVGVVVMFLLIFLSFSLVFLIIGADLAYKPGTYEVSMLWIAISTVLGLIVAIIGGYVCRIIAKDRATTVVFAGVLLGIGLAAAIMQAVSPSPAEVARTAEVSNMEAMQKSISPLWVLFMNPFISAIGVWVGGGLGGNKE